MQQLPLFYRKLAAVSRERHKDWYVDTDQGFGFARATNSVYVATLEFAQAAREYPIVFGRDAQGRAFPVALLGLRQDQNLLVDAAGAWLGSYIPAYVRRYPFILAAADPAVPERLTVCIDEAYSGFNTVKEGAPLIPPNGDASGLLARTMQFLEEFHRQNSATEEFCTAVEAAGLFDTARAEFTLPTGEKFALAGLFCVPRERLRALPAETLKRFAAANYLEFLYLHLQSLANFEGLVRRLQAIVKDLPQA